MMSRSFWLQQSSPHPLQGFLLKVRSLGKIQQFFLFTEVTGKTIAWGQALPGVQLADEVSGETQGNVLWLAPLNSFAGVAFDNPLKVAMLSTAVTLLMQILPENHPYPLLYHKTKELFAALPSSLCAEPLLKLYLNFELQLLKDLGFALTLSPPARPLVAALNLTGQMIERYLLEGHKLPFIRERILRAV